MLKRVLHIILLALLLLPLMFASCQKEGQWATEGVELEFSCDTMAFDTVFTQMGTTTRQFKVYNRTGHDCRIREVTLQNGYSSRFRLNVDGDTSMVAKDLYIAAGDSMFVFVRANINPNLSTEPFLIEDAVLFRMDDGMQRIPLTAYGRNAIYHIPTDTIIDADTAVIDQFGRPYAYSVIDCEHWRHDLPHVIVGYAVVDSRRTLHLEAGDELYFCEDAVLWIYDSATLDVRGTEERPVLFTSVRHDGHYDALPGQWGFIWMMQGCVNNYIDHAVIENAFVGLQADSCSNSNPTLAISNTVIRNHTLAGMIGNTAYMLGDNLLIYNCGTATLALQYGGWYDFGRCTFADYWTYEPRTVPSVQITNYRDYEETHYIWPMQSQLTDCIIYGSRQSELIVDLDDRAEASATLTHCLVRGGEWDEDPKFADPHGGDYHLEEDSPAQGIGYQYPACDTADRAARRLEMKRNRHGYKL